MLTKEQILIRMRGFNCPKYLTESCWQPIYDQCVAAIDLAAENEQLKSKLDAVKEECEKHRPANKIDRRCLWDNYDLGQFDLADQIQAIIGKDGGDK